MQIIDIYTHIFGDKFFDELTAKVPQLGNIGMRARAVKHLFDLDGRFREMDKVGEGYTQVISLANPALEDVVRGQLGVDLAKAGNDAMAEMCASHPDRFCGFVAAVNLHEVEASVKEAHRAIKDLGARGIQVFTNIAGQPLDDAKFQPIFAVAAEHDLPIWMHPARTASMTDYASEKQSRFEVWWGLGWPYETSTAMIRLALSGLFDRHPDIKIITHHCGGGVPFFEGRIAFGFKTLGTRTANEDYSDIVPSLKRPPMDCLKSFYGDTAMLGGRNWIEAGVDFFGFDRIVFASDVPFGDPVEALDVIRSSGFDPAMQEKVLSGNAKRLMKMA